MSVFPKKHETVLPYVNTHLFMSFLTCNYSISNEIFNINIKFM